MSVGRESSTESTIGLAWSRAKWECGAACSKSQEKAPYPHMVHVCMHMCVCEWVCVCACYLFNISLWHRATHRANAEAHSCLVPPPIHPTTGHMGYAVCTCLTLTFTRLVSRPSAKGRRWQKSLSQGRGEAGSNKKRECIWVKPPNPCTCSCSTAPLDFTYRTQLNLLRISV